MDENIFDLSDKAREAISERIAKANEASLDGELGMELDYDPDIDYLRILVRPGGKSLAFESEDTAGSVLLYDPETYLIVGLEVPSFMDKVRKGILVEEFWTFAATLISEHGPSIYLAAESESRRAGKAFRELVPA